MGTNYYLVCRNCGTRTIHIGKQSAGHDFASNSTKKEMLEQIDDCLNNLNHSLMNEYGDILTKSEFLSRVTDKWQIIKG